MENQGKYLTSFQRKLLERSLQKDDLCSDHQCRIKIMLLADEGFTKAEISKTLKCALETARYWMGQARAGQAHNWQDCPRGRPKTVNAKYLNRLQELATCCPRDLGYPFERWTGQWLSKHLNKELGIQLSSRHVNRLLKQMGLSVRARSVDTNNSSLCDNTKGSNIALHELSAISTSASTPQWQLNFLN